MSVVVFAHRTKTARKRAPAADAGRNTRSARDDTHSQLSVESWSQPWSQRVLCAFVSATYPT